MTDVLVIGSGPAGMSAAMHLAGSGLSVIVVERLEGERFSRYHRICGEAVSDRSFKRLGWRPSSAVRRVDTIGIRMDGGVSIDIPVSGSVVDRPSMLAEMRSSCDCRFVRGSVVRVTAGDGTYTAELLDGSSIRSRYLVGADGAHSVVRRDVFGRGPTRKLAVCNCIAEGEEDILSFTVGDYGNGFYGWRFPSADGRVSVGFPRGHTDPGDVPGLVGWGARDLPFGVLDRVVDGNAILVGDAACLANPLCYGGIGAAMISGRKAAEAVIAGDPGRYARWVSRDIMFDRHFMRAHETFEGMTVEEIADAMLPFRKGYSLLRGAKAVLRRPRLANVYISVYIAFRNGW